MASLQQDGGPARTGQHHGASKPDFGDSVHAVVGRVVSKEFGAAARIVSVSSERSRFATRSPADIMTIGLEDGSALRLFVKRLEGDATYNPDKLRRDREPLVYRWLFAARNLPVPILYESCWSASDHRYELFLEYVDDWNLKYHGIDQWETAAARLAAFHAHFASEPDRLARSRFLLQLDRRYFSGWAGRAVAAVAGLSERLAGRLEAALRRHDRAIAVIGKQPVTLVHNDLAPKNVIADTSRRPARICIVDWEMAGVGCGLLDLVHLTHGLSGREEEAVCGAYCDALSGTGLLPASRELPRLISACRLQNTLYRLAHVQQWGVARTTAEGWVEDVARLQAVV